MMKASKSLHFLKKKPPPAAKQKDFFMLGHWRWWHRAAGPESKKFFGSRPAEAFFQKRTALL
jgi:hypothetical protein